MSLSITHDDQRDDHCRMTFMGQDWWIAQVFPDVQVMLLTNEFGLTLLDYSNVNWPAYQARAVAMIIDRFAEAAHA